MLSRLVYLSYGLAVILGFIGVKLVLEALHENSLPFVNGGEPIHGIPTIPIWLSLTVILGVLVLATVASLLKTRGQLPEESPALVTPENANQAPPSGPAAEAQVEARLADEQRSRP